VECTQLWKIATYMKHGVERIDTLAETPWHRSEFDQDLCERIHFNIPPNTPNPDLKEEWAEQHRGQISHWQSDDLNRVILYSDGSLSLTREGRHSGWGFVCFRNNAINKMEKGATGAMAEAYDAEMEALTQASAHVVSLSRGGSLAGIHSIHIFSDNTGAIQRIFKGTPGKAQSCSLRFRRNILQLLDTHPQIEITIEWAPGHTKIRGNEIADRLAKRGSRCPTQNPNWASYAYVGAAWRRALGDLWKQRWGEIRRHPRSEYTQADHFPPQLSPTKRFRELSRATFSRTFQARTGHAHIGAYYARFVPSEQTECTCGERLQSRLHILQECDHFERFRHLLGEHDEERALDTLLGTDDGINRLAEFIEVSGAFAKETSA
jgi:ribonuclease HI